MRTDKEEATKLRLAGKSYNEISSTLLIPKSTLSNWFGNLDWSTKVKVDLNESIHEEQKVRLVRLNKFRKEKLDQLYDEAKIEAAQEFNLLKFDPLFVAGLMLYWGEGDKLTRHHVKLTNTDPAMIKLYVTFLKQTCGIDESLIRGQILLYPDLDPINVLNYWLETTGLPEKNFTKSTVIKGKHKARRLPNGVCMINISSTYLKVKIIKWIELLQKELIEKAYCENI